MNAPKIITWYALDHNVLCVAVEGSVKDWAAYVGAVEGNDHESEALGVAMNGSKLSYQIAKLLFPSVDQAFRWRK